MGAVRNTREQEQQRLAEEQSRKESLKDSIQRFYCFLSIFSHFFFYYLLETFFRLSLKNNSHIFFILRLIQFSDSEKERQKERSFSFMRRGSSRRRRRRYRALESAEPLGSQV
jgi:hypothetical protein